MRKPIEKEKIKNVKKAAIIILVAVFAFWGLNSLILPGIIKQKINDGDFGNYKLQTEEVKVNLLARKLVLDSLHFESSTDGLDVLVPGLKINGIDIIRLLFKKTFVASSINLSRAEVLINQPKDTSKAAAQDTSENEPADFFIGDVTVAEANFTLVNKNDTSRFSNIGIELLNLSNNGDGQYIFKSYSFDRLSGNIGEWSVPLSNNLYTLNGTELELASSRKISVSQLKLITNYPKYEVGHKTGIETDWFDFTIEDIKVDELNLQESLNSRGFVANKVMLGKVNGSAFRDKRLPRGDKPDTKLPMQALNDLTFPFHLDSLSFENAYIQYEEHVKGANEAGKVFFSDLNAEAYQVSNARQYISRVTTISANGRLMGKARMDANFTMPNKKYPGEYKVNGKLEPTSFKIINPIVNENLSADIKSGYIHELNFDFHYNNDLSEGALTIQYSDLKIDLLSRRKDDAKPVQSMFFNGLILKKDNLKDKKVYREGTIHFKRDKKKSIFNYWWKSLYSGIKSVAVPKPLS